MKTWMLISFDDLQSIKIHAFQKCVNFTVNNNFAPLHFPNFLKESFLLKFFDKNPMNELQRQSICPLDSSNQFELSAASTIVMSLPILYTMALSGWNMKSKEIHTTIDASLPP